MIGLYLDPDTHDLAVDASGALRVARDAQAVAQHVKQRLLAHEGEWFLDTRAGVPWFDRIMGREFNPDVAEAVVKAEIFATPGVTEISSLSVRFDKHTRAMTLDGFDIYTEFDEGSNG